VESGAIVLWRSLAQNLIAGARLALFLRVRALDSGFRPRSASR